MRTLESLKDTLEAAGIDLGSLALRSDGTVGPADGHTTERDLAPALPALGVTSGTGELRLLEVIGEGGMGVVHAAEQTSLARTVAVKTLREEARTPARVADFVREARVTGALEHPNVVPVHGLGVGADGAPLMIMKRIEGRSLLELVEEAPADPARFDDHVEVLIAVCRAVERAHARGVLHRDLKPENILVGDFGEVLVVDWGLAAGFREGHGIEGLPWKDTIRSVVGTPRYMAPEMAAGDGGSLGPHTDVYLLGATLHHALTGETRHDGPTLMAMLYRAYASEPHAYGDDVPEELAAIANRACAAEPKDRFESVAAFREALVEYRAHVGSRRLAKEAERRLAEDGDADLAAARFGFEQALAGWPEYEAARRGLAATLERMTERALERDALAEAEALLEELWTCWPLASRRESLEVRVEALRAELGRRTARLRALEREAREADLGLAAESRRAYGIAFGVLVGLYNVALGVVDALGLFTPSHLLYVVGAGAAAVLVGVVAIVRLRRLVPNRAARRLLWGLAIIVSAQVPVFLALGALGVDIERALAVSLLQLGGSYLIKSVTLDPRMNAVGIGTVLLGAGTFFAPQLSWFAVGAAYGVFFVIGSLLSFEMDEAPDDER